MNKNLDFSSTKFRPRTHFSYTTTKNALHARKIRKATRPPSFDESPISCNEKFVLFTKNPICAYILFIHANGKYQFSYASPCVFGIFRGFFVENEKFSFFSFPLKLDSMLCQEFQKHLTLARTLY